MVDPGCSTTPRCATRSPDATSVGLVYILLDDGVSTVNQNADLQADALPSCSPPAQLEQGSPEPTLPRILKKFIIGGVTAEVRWSELQRDPKGVAALAEQGDVRVRRRDGTSLLLVTEDRASSAAEGGVAAARALRNAFAHLSPEDALDSLHEEFPWVDVLPAADRTRFATDFIRAVQASAELGQWSVLAQALVEWRSTAAIHTDPSLAEELSRPLDGDFGPVPTPDSD